MHAYINKIDSDRFGFPIARIANNIENPELIIRELKKISVRLIIARIDFSNLDLITRLEKIGFSYKDAQVTFSFSFQKKLPKKEINQLSIVPFNERHLPKMIDMTRISFNNYGHYFADDKLDKQRCNEIYVDWLQRCCENRDIADEIIVAEVNNVVVGYLAIKKIGRDHGFYIAGVIGAVDPDYRRMGIFRAINIESLYIGARLGANHVENNVLITNFSVMKTYTSLCYSIIRSEITMHYWYE